MNWSRRFLRLWMIASIGWIAAIVLVEQPDHSLEIYLRSGNTLTELDHRLSQSDADPVSIPWSGALVSRDRVRTDVAKLRETRRKIRGELVETSELSLLPPLTLLAFGWIAAWATAWFRKEAS